MKFLTGLGFLLAWPALAWSASGYLYDCDMQDIERGRGWVSPKIAIIVTADGVVTVVDALTLTFATAPVRANVLRDNDKRLIVKWSLQNVRADSGRSFANFDYRASIAKRTGQVELTAGPRTFDAGLRGAGTCVRRTQ
ncbi:hypothetical protein [Sulfitobacter pacificus]|uniref:hypothetical protein n=1 Tax=Sulfitobacter pacificus TaxID=1499314 RepID=UPI00333FB124